MKPDDQDSHCSSFIRRTNINKVLTGNQKIIMCKQHHVSFYMYEHLRFNANSNTIFYSFGKQKLCETKRYVNRHQGYILDFMLSSTKVDISTAHKN